MYSCSKWSLFTFTCTKCLQKNLLPSLKTLYVVLFSTGTPLFLVFHLMGTDLAQLML